MWRGLVMSVTDQLNFFPSDSGVSKHYSPWQLMGKPQLDYKRHFTACFGDYVQANNENKPTNDMCPRTLDCIYLYPNVHDPQGGHVLMNIETDAVIVRPRVWKIPITDLVIKAVNALGAKQGFKNTKPTGKANEIKLRPADWRTGVDCDGELTNTHDNIDDEGDENDNDIPVSYTHLTLPTKA